MEIAMLYAVLSLQIASVAVSTELSSVSNLEEPGCSLVLRDQKRSDV